MKKKFNKQKINLAKLLLITIVTLSTGIQQEEVILANELNIRQAPKFSDVNTSADYYNGLEYLYINNIINGTTDSTFSPDVYMSRAMLVSMLYRIEGEPEVLIDASNKFLDIKNEDWYSDAVIWANTEGLVNGVTETLFAPNENLTKEQVIVILDRYYENYYLNNNNFLDVSSLDNVEGIADIELASSYSKEAINNMYEFGILYTDKNNRLSPQSDISRADVAYMLGELLIKINK